MVSARLLYRFGAASAALVAFLGMSYFYGHGDNALYNAILRGWGVIPFQFPFVDISGSLAAWECARQGLDVILADPCDILHRGYTYSPLWMAAAGIPLGVEDRVAVGWCLDLIFIVSLALLPPPKSPRELLLMLAATLSTMVAFAVERANPDLLMFLLALASGILAEGRLAPRLLGYVLAFVAALLKYYPIMALIVVFRERLAVFVPVVVVGAGLIAGFWAEYYVDIARGVPHIPRGPYNTDLFSAQNLPLLLGEAVGNATASQLVGQMTALSIYGALVATLVGVWRRLSPLSELRAAVKVLPSFDRVLLAVGSAVTAGCFFAGQSVGYRGIFLLLVIPGLLTLSRSTALNAGRISLGTAIIIVLLMWGEGLRLGLYHAVELLNISSSLASELEIQFWLLRELSWWWSVGIMLAVLAAFLRDSPVVCRTASLLGQWPAARGG